MNPEEYKNNIKIAKLLRLWRAQDTDLGHSPQHNWVFLCNSINVSLSGGVWMC